MEKIWAVINGGLVENLIVAEQSFVDMISSQHDYVIRIDEMAVDEKPSIGWSYDGENFSAPPEE